MSEVTRLFDTMYEGAKEVLKTMKAPLVERSVKRKLQAMHDDADRIIDEAKMKLLEERQKLHEADFNIILGFKRDVSKAEDLKTDRKSVV